MPCKLYWVVRTISHVATKPYAHAGPGKRHLLCGIGVRSGSPSSWLQMNAGLSRVSRDTKGKAYAAWLGFYNSCPQVRLGTDRLVSLANEFATLMGCRCVGVGTGPA
jgi:hypothetical protein